MIDQYKTKLVDFHCHLDLYSDHKGAVFQREREEVFTLAVTTTPKAFPRNKELADQTKYVRASLGLHPQLVADRAHELSIWKDFLPKSRYVGEVGLDATRSHYHSFNIQKHVFEEILKTCATGGDKILSVHSARCTKVVLDMIEARLPIGSGKVVLHWFTGSLSEMHKATEIGCYFSVNLAMLQNSRIRKLVQLIPIDRILTETDGPFTDKNPNNKRPADVAPTRNGLAELLMLQNEEMSNLICSNLRQLLS